MRAVGALLRPLQRRLTVADVDRLPTPELQYALDTFGQSPVIVRTASGKHHAYYRHGGERRQIRPDKAHPIDILGEGGFCVAPPSARETAAAMSLSAVVSPTSPTCPRCAPAHCRSPRRLSQG